jgi:PAS domain S-box-containing protein
MTTRPVHPLTPDLPVRAIEESNRLFGRFALLWAPMLLVILVVEWLVLADPERWPLLGLTMLAGGTMFVAALWIRSHSGVPLVYLAAALLSACGIAVGLLATTGNDGALILPFLGAVMLVAFAGRRRQLLVAFFLCWTAGLVGAYLAYAVSELRLAPHLEPLAVNMTTAAVMSFLGYGLLWWVWDRLTRTIDALRNAERQSREAELAARDAELQARDAERQSRDAEQQARDAERQARDAETQARAAEGEARSSVETLRALVDGSPVPTIALTTDNRVAAWNPAAVWAFGWTEEELLGKCLPESLAACADLYSGIVTPRTALTEAMRGGRAVCRRKNGSEVQVEQYVAIQRDDNGHQTGRVLQLVDVSERESLRRRLVGLERMEAVGRMAGGIAHDFNNLLTAVIGYGEVLHGSFEPEDPRREDVHGILLAGERGAALVRQLLAFSSHQVLEPIRLDLNELLIGLEPMLERLIGSEVRIEIKPGADLGQVVADPIQLEVVIVNLVVNARDAMPSGGRLTIATANLDLDEAAAEHRYPLLPGPYIQLRVGDTGVGMSPEVLARIFEPFFTTKPHGKGTGLGLATVYGIVRQSGGLILAESLPGEGTIFEVDLPRVPTAIVKAAVQTSNNLPLGGSETILLVDDEVAVQGVAARILRRMGYRVLPATDGADAARIMAAEAIDLLVTDVVMPDIRGPILAAQLREIRPGLRALYMSGFADDPVARGESEPSAAFVSKPFTANELGRAVRRMLDVKAEPAG